MANSKINLMCRTAIFVAIAAALPFQSSYAQSGEQEMLLEEVIVTGKRRSLELSLDLKRDAKQIMDSISAEELGLFPDANVADSLQHITGVTISRTHGGEGQYVAIRGLPSQYNIVTLNNRILATDDDGRNFAFDVLPSEVISGADVLKSPTASGLEGSIGGSINLRTARPLDTPGMHGSARVEGNYNDLSEDAGFKFSGVFTDTYADDTVGLLVSAIYSDRDVRSDFLGEMYFNQGWPEASDIDAEDQLGDADVLTSPCCYSIGTYLEERERWAVSAALQFRPNDRFEMTFDAMFTQLDSPASGYTEAFYVEWYPESEAGEYGPWSDIVVDNGLVTSMTIDGLVPEQVTRIEHRVVDTSQFGWNGIFDATDSLQVIGDIYYSKAERNSGGKDSWVVAGARGNGGHRGYFSLNANGLPNIVMELEDGRSLTDLDNDDYGVHWAELGGTDISDTVGGATLDFVWTPDSDYFTAFKFGGAYTSRQKTRDTVDNMSGACNYCDYPFTFADVGVDVVRPMPFDNFLKGVKGDIPREFVVFDLDAYWAALQASDGQTINGTYYPENYSALMNPVRNAVKSYDVDEATVAAYIQFDFAGENWFANAGLRYVTTDDDVDYAVNEIVSITREDSGNATSHYDVVYSDAEPKSDSGSYSEWLPSLNAGWWIKEDLLLRGALATTMARPSLNQLAPTREDYAYDGDFSMYVDGSVNLGPVTANQADLSLEWYYKESSALTVALFWKDIEDSVTYKGFYDVPIAGQLFFVEAPVNGEAADVQGIEFGIQHFFDSGFGIVANYTYTDSSASADGEEYGLEGVSEDAYSIALIYSDEHWEANVSADYSGPYIDALYSPIEGTPTTAEGITWVSASIKYAFNEQWNIYLQGTNLKDEASRSFIGDRRLIQALETWGRTYNMGVSYRF